jgi:ferredoxin
MKQDSTVQLTILDHNHSDENAQPLKHILKVRKGLGMQAISLQHETGIEYDCRKADCGICIVRVLSGMESLSEPTFEEKDFLKAMMAEKSERLCCQMRVLAEGVVLSIENNGPT